MSHDTSATVDVVDGVGSDSGWLLRARDLLCSLQHDQGAEVGATNAHQRRRMTCERLVQRNLELKVRSLEIDEALLSADVGASDERTAGLDERLNRLEREADTLLAESDEIEELLQQKFGIEGGGRLWIEKGAVSSVTRAASVTAPVRS